MTAPNHSTSSNSSDLVTAEDRAAKRGRPPKPPSERKSQAVRLNLTEREFDALCVDALRAHCSVAELVRAVLFKGQKIGRQQQTV